MTRHYEITQNGRTVLEMEITALERHSLCGRVQAWIDAGYGVRMITGRTKSKFLKGEAMEREDMERIMSGGLR